MGNKRYIRQTLLSEIGEEGQQKLTDANICIVGCGGLGSIAASYLAAAGVGQLILVDGDKPELSNLHRQVFFTGKENLSKAAALAERIAENNPEIKVEVVSMMLSKNNIVSILNDVTLVLECTDDMMCKYLVNDWCSLNKIPLVYGAIFKYEGYLSLFKNTSSNCIHLRDIFPEPDLSIPTCSEVGVLSTIAGMIGLLQANEAIKYILQIETSLSGYLLTYHALTNEQLKLKLKKNWSGDIKKIYTTENYGYALPCDFVPEIDLQTLLKHRSDYHLVSILEKAEHESIDNNVEHMPLSQIDTTTILKTGKPMVFYCMSGKRSAHLVSSFLKYDASANVFSLKGGLKKFKE